MTVFVMYLFLSETVISRTNLFTGSSLFTPISPGISLNYWQYSRLHVCKTDITGE